jgi:hypothetical protein
LIDAISDQEIPYNNEKQESWIPNSDSVFNKFVVNLLHVRLHFGKVGQHIVHDSAPLFMSQCIGFPITCTSELPSEKAEVRFIFGSIVSRGWIMHAGKVVTIVHCCEV